jgi:chemotaxis protein CheX
VTFELIPITIYKKQLFIKCEVNVSQAANPLLDKNLINAFVEGVVKTLDLMANVQVQVGAPQLGQAKMKGDLAGIIGMVAGGMKGKLAICFSKESLFTILQQMLGETYTELNPAVADAAGELTNMIYGTAKTTMNQLGYNFEMAIPTVVYGDLNFSKNGSLPSLIIPFKINESAQFYIELSVQ